MLAFQDSLDQTDARVRKEINRRAKLRALCETRWASRADALYTFRAAFPVVVQALEALSQDGDGKARATYAPSSSLILSLLYVQQIMSFHVMSLSTILQGKSVDLIEAGQEARVVINIIRAERGDPSVWKEVYEQGKQIAAEFDIEPSVNNRKAATQGECPSHKPRVPLARSCVSPSY